jgi:hypothetical protein
MNALLQVLQMITRSLIADKIASWLHHDLTLCELVDWAENALLREDFAENDASELAAIVGRLGAADVRNFGLWWEDCEQLLKQLGYVAHVDITAA